MIRNLVREFSEIVGCSVEELATGDDSNRLSLIRGIYAKLRVDSHGESIRQASEELGLSVGKTAYARKKVNEALSVDYEDVSALWRSVEPLGLSYLYNKSINLAKSNRYEAMTDSVIKKFLDKACAIYDTEYENYSHKKMNYIRAEGRRWLDAIVETAKKE